ncbi:MAG: hypothetical protein CME62_14205 [Halobacteriovoraceae bacterium]|nr:hypothetical protein [Halobacteriovoraceae bacterium]
MKKTLKIILITCVLVSSAWAEVINIPLQYTANPAKDLSENNQVLSVLNVKNRAARGEDISLLDPIESDIWSNQIGQSLQDSLDELHIKTHHVHEYVDKVISTIGSFRFIIREQEGSKRNFNIWLGNNSRAILLRKNLLRKLGYKIPKIQHLQNLKIQFRGKKSLEIFIEELENATFANSQRWEVSRDNDRYVLTLQDVLAFEPNAPIYNLAQGEMVADIIQHRRVMNALAIFYAVADLRESVDGFPWSVGKVDNKLLTFDFSSADAFSTTYHDAKWAVRRLAQLSESDIFNITALMKLPDSVEILMAEKIKSRINSLVRIFFPNQKELPVHYEVSDNSGELYRGRLTQDAWPGHAARYSFDDTESPLSRDEMAAYFRSKVYSGVIENLVGIVNSNLLYSTDIQKAAIEKAVDAQRKQFLDLLETGEFKKIPFSAWIIPTAKGHISASRDIVTGSYLGTDNLIQVADSLEFIGEVGAFVGTLGLPSKYQAYAGASARFSRSYTHVKSINSIKSALKEPYRNIIVPAVKRKKAKNIIQMITDIRSEDFQNLADEEREKELGEIFKEFDRVMEVGDSLIISNNLIFAGSVTGGMQIPVGPLEAEALVNFNMRKLNIWRLHILRASDSTFQIYKSKANSLGRGIGISLKAYVPIINLNWDKQSGKVKTQFNTINFEKDQTNSELERKLLQLRQIFVSNSVELLQVDQSPYVIEHNFVEKSSDSGFFTRQKKSVKLIDQMKITHPDMYTAELYVRNVVKLSGRNYMQVAYDTLNAILDDIIDAEDLSISNTESGNPGDSFYGESFSRSVMSEIPFNHEASEIPFEDYVQVKSQWKGWKANRGKLLEIKEEIQKKYGQDIFNDELFYDTQEIQLYTVDIVLSLYHSGINHMINYNHDEFVSLLEKYLVLPWPEHRSHFRRLGYRTVNVYERKKKRLIRKLRKAHERLQREGQFVLSPKQKSIDITQIIDSLDAMVPRSIFEHIVGGDKNFYLKGSINGFRGGTENGEESIISHSIGEFGSDFPAGILDTLRSAIKISRGELGAYWFLRRLQ